MKNKAKLLSALIAGTLLMGSTSVHAASVDGDIEVTISVTQDSIEIDPDGGGVPGDEYIDFIDGKLEGVLNLTASATEKTKQTLKLYGIRSSREYDLIIKANDDVFSSSTSNTINVSKLKVYNSVNTPVELNTTGVYVDEGYYELNGNDHDIVFELDELPGYPSGDYTGSLTIEIEQR